MVGPTEDRPQIPQSLHGIASTNITQPSATSGQDIAYSRQNAENDNTLYTQYTDRKAQEAEAAQFAQNVEKNMRYFREKFADVYANARKNKPPQ